MNKTTFSATIVVEAPGAVGEMISIDRTKRILESGFYHIEVVMPISDKPVILIRQTPENYTIDKVEMVENGITKVMYDREGVKQ